MKTKMCVLALLAVIALSPSMLGQEKIPAGVVHGPKAGFKISAPEGWVVDNEAGVNQDMPCVLYPKGSSWSDAKTVMYAKVASPQWEGVNAFVAWAIQGMKAKHGTPKEKITSGKTKDGHDYFINEYPATKTYSQWERVGYVQLPQGVAYIVLTSRNHASYQKDSGALEKVLKTLVYVEPKSETASGQEYARRYRQLLDQHAEAQIEPLLTEWREKAPDDPDAWITSANYYFNERQMRIEMKEPRPGDITMTDPRTGKVGIIVHEVDKPGMKRAVELLQEATTKFPDHLDIWCGLAFFYQDSGDFENELSTVKKMVAYARGHPTQLKWLKGEPLGQPADKFIPDKLHEYGSYYEQKENAEDDKRWFQISTVATDQYPNDPQGFKDAAGYWADIGEWQKARESFEKAHQLDPKSVVALIGLGQISAEMKDFVSARKYYEDALKLEPNGQYAQNAKEALRKLKKTPEDRQAGQPNLKEANGYNERGIAKGVKGDIDGAIADFTRAIELDPKYSKTYSNRGIAKEEKGDMDGAIADCTRAIKLDPRYAPAYSTRGLAKKNKGDLNEAITDYTRAVELDPKYVNAYYNRGLAKWAKGDINGAVADYTRAVELDPKYANAYYNRGVAKWGKGDIDGAIADYTRVIEINPNNPKYAVAYDDRGIAKQAKGDLDGAIADCTRAIELNPKYANAYNNRGSFKGIKGDVVGAIADVNRAIELDPKLTAAYYNRSYTKQGKGDIDGAIADYTHAIELDPRCARCYLNRGGCYFKKQQYDAAIKDLQKAIELDPKNGVNYSSLGWCQLFNRKPHESIAASLKALELSPDHAVMIKGNLAHGYLFDNQFEKAKALYLENKDAKLHDGRPFSQAVLDDFKDFQEAGITHPDMEKIKALLTTKPEQ